MSEDDDWFERALRESDGEEDGEGSGRDDEAPASEDDKPPASEDDKPPAGSESDGPARDGDGRENGEPPDAEGGPPADRSTGESDSGELFEDDFGSALQGADVPAGEAEGEFGGGGDDPFGAGAFDPEAESFGTPGTDVSEEEFETELARIDLGIKGLDAMVRGGVPERSLLTVIGSAGTGKTTFGLQFLRHGLQEGERGVYISLEESQKRIIDSATEKGWAFDEYVEDGQLAIVDMDPLEMANSLSSIRSDLPRLVEDFGASRIVIDSVSLLELMYDDRARRRNEVYEFASTLKDVGVTALLTSEASEDSPYASRHGIVEYLTDAVFVQRYVRPSDFQETRLAIEIQKIRDADHSREMKPYEITDDGINVYQQANIF
ncbi:MAG: KaiC domain-containing protein [Halobacteriales archaeon]